MKKSRAISLLLALLVLVGCFAFESPIPEASASDDVVTATKDDFAYTKLPADNPTYIALGQYMGTATKIRLPETIDGLPVISLWSSAFVENENIKYIELSANLQELSPKAFNLCSSLTEIAVPSTNKYFSSVDGVLYNKDKTTLLVFPAGRGGSFTIPESVVTVGPYAFESCYNLTDVKMYNNVLAIQQFAFAFCWNLKSIKLSDNLTRLGFKALAYCDNLLEIHLPATLSIIGTQAIAGGIDSDGNIYYNFINGLYYVKGTKSEEYIKNLHLTPGYTFPEARTITDIDTNVVLYDYDNILSTDEEFDLNVKVLKNSDYSAKLPARYAEMGAYSVSLTKDGKTTSLPKEAVIRFNSFKNAIPTATKIYIPTGNTLIEKTRAPQAAFVGTTFKGTQTYVITTNNDFSLKGDIDGDGTRSIYDARFALCISAGLVKNITSAQLTTANVDGVTGVKTNDAREILKYAAGIKK